MGLGRIAGLEKHIRPYLNGRDLTGVSRNVMVIDLFGLSSEQVRRQFPEVYQWVYDLVKPERDQNRRASLQENWWIFGEPDQHFAPHSRDCLAISPPSKLRNIVSSCSLMRVSCRTTNSSTSLFQTLFTRRVVQSNSCFWALAAGSTLEDRPVYVKTTCFDTFPISRCAGNQQQSHPRNSRAP